MLQIDYFPDVTGDAAKIVNKHICEHILSGIYLCLETEFPEEMLEYDIFPDWYKGDKVSFVKTIVQKIEDDDETYELNALEKLVLMNCLQEFYADDCDDSGNRLSYSLDLANRVWLNHSKLFDLNTFKDCETINGAFHIVPIKDAYERMIVLTNVLENITETDLVDGEGDVEFLVKSAMCRFEDLTEYENLFADCDYELLMDFTPKQALQIAKEYPELGLDVSIFSVVK